MSETKYTILIIALTIIAFLLSILLVQTSNLIKMNKISKQKIIQIEERLDFLTDKLYETTTSKTINE